MFEPRPGIARCSSHRVNRRRAYTLQASLSCARVEMDRANAPEVAAHSIRSLVLNKPIKRTLR